MRLLRHFTANDEQLEPFPFQRELSMEAYLVENEGVLALDDNQFTNVDVIEAELTLKQGRKSKYTDGRIDIVVTFSQEFIGIVELKLGELEYLHLQQLEDYLREKEQILKQYPDILDNDIISEPKWIGVLAGTSINPELAEKISTGYQTTQGIQIAALTIQRFRSAAGNVYVTTDTYFKDTLSAKDKSKFQFNGKLHGKGRLVLEVIKYYVEQNPNITFVELNNIFPKNLQGSTGVFATDSEANEIYSSSNRKRHFIEPGELIMLADSTIAVCSQWGIKNIWNFIEKASELGITINQSNDT